MRLTKFLQIQISPTPNGGIHHCLQNLCSVNGLDYGAFGRLIQHCSDHRLLRQAKQLHARIVLSSLTPDNFLASKLITFYSKSNHLYEAHKVFDKILDKNIFSWNAMLIGYSIHNMHVHTLNLLSSLLPSYSLTLKPDNFTITCVLKALSVLFPDSILAKEVQCFVLRHGFDSDIFVVNALITYYSRCDEHGIARILFDRMHDRDIVSWNSMIAGYSQGGFYEDCKELYRKMLDSTGLRPNGVTVVSVLQACAQSNDLVFGMKVHQFIIERKVEMDVSAHNSLIGLYAKCGSLDYARELFNEMSNKDEVTYGSIVSGLVQNNCNEGILELVQEMQEFGFRPNAVTLSSILPTFSCFSNLKGGKAIHAYAIRNGYAHNIYVATSIIDAYAKLGFLRGAQWVFDQSKDRSLIVWTAIISAYSAHGDANAALRLFGDMLSNGTQPDPVTFTAVLAACAHSGMVNEAWKIFDEMFLKYGLQPCVEHYACMVGVLSRAGMLSEAAEFICKMPIEPNAKVWGALLNGVSVSGNYVIMANLYSQAGRWEEAENIREKMKKIGLKKIPGTSWIETSGGLRSFIARDVSSERSEEIYGMLEGLLGLMREEGYTLQDELDEECAYI
ncbi:Pentatricopeptide repeat-containing protein [Vitis vinifera]|uniref:Pentatricopeptide repeat-containing protein n=1 Tax=Vitis vinifera TaxID=29760 RepID=A0A438IQ88_VITVI|nr:Pentatricopeptide repeat-containing protein [Vitis vinifera]